MLLIYDGDYIDSDLANPQISRRHAGMLDELINEIQDTNHALSAMLRRSTTSHCPDFNVKAIEFLLKQGINIARIAPKSPGLGLYRIIYAIDCQTDNFQLLAIVIKNPTATDNPQDYIYSEETYNYEPQHPITVRICQEYERRGIPRIRI